MTIKEVAEHAGVSTATISRVINNNGFVNSKTREQILRTIKEVGYKPTTRQKIRSSDSAPLKSKSVALIWVGEGHFSRTGQEMVMGMIDQLKSLGASLTVDYITKSDDIPKCLLEGKIDGVLLHGSEPAERVCTHLREFPTIWLLQSGSVNFGDHVQPDHNYIGRTAAKHLIEQGNQKLCCISYTREHADPTYWQSRANGFINCVKAKGVPCAILHCPENQGNLSRQEQVKALVDEFEKLTPRPDGLFIANDLGDHILNELNYRGITPMKEITIIAGDISVNSKAIDINFFSKELGKLSIDALIWRIKNPDMPLVTHSIKSELVFP